MVLVRSTVISFFPLVSVSFAIAMAAVLWFVPRVRRFALRIKAVQQGGSSHGSGVRQHQGAVPNIGGIAILGGFLLAVLIGSLVAPAAIDEYRVQLLAIALGGALMTLVGFMDDMWEVPPALRLAAQVVAAGILVVNGVRIGFVTDYFGNATFLYIPETFSILLTILWVVGFTNAFNFIDGLDGLSSGITAISSMSLLAVAVQFADRGAAVLLLAAMAGASLGFLRYNFGPAAITMGDSGAYLLGYVLAAVSVLGALKVTAAVSVVAPILILALPVINITQVTVRRLRRGASPALASNDHIHDMLRLRSGSKRLTVVLLWAATMLLGILGMLLSSTPPVLTFVTIIVTVVMIAAVSLLRLAEVRRLGEVAA
jgi:UDP-GlcNAc:undecaprenyl-phosphate GlcNAc-1-phosphate transferase